jgi:hypothetical protein
VPDEIRLDKPAVDRDDKHDLRDAHADDKGVERLLSAEERFL